MTRETAPSVAPTAPEPLDRLTLARIGNALEARLARPDVASLPGDLVALALRAGGAIEAATKSHSRGENGRPSRANGETPRAAADMTRSPAS